MTPDLDEDEQRARIGKLRAETDEIRQRLKYRLWIALGAVLSAILTAGLATGRRLLSTPSS